MMNTSANCESPHAKVLHQSLVVICDKPQLRFCGLWQKLTEDLEEASRVDRLLGLVSFENAA